MGAIKARIWQAFCDIDFVYDEDKERPKDAHTKEEENIQRLNELKRKGKLSKKKQKELSKMISDFKNKKKPKNDEIDKRIHKVVREELKESSAVISDKRTNKTGKQILLKVFYICFRILREFPFTHGFDFCVKAVEKHSIKADPRFLKDIVDELKHAFEIFENDKEGNRSHKTNKQLLVLHAIIKISNEKSKLKRHRTRYRRILQCSLLLQDFEDSDRKEELCQGRRKGSQDQVVATSRRTRPEEKTD